MPTVVMNTDAGVIGDPPGTKESGNRVDFITSDFERAIADKGYRIAWSRALLCPCIPVNTQTEQADPNCTLCRGSGWLYFAPSKATLNKLIVGELDEVQTRIVQDKGAVIEGLMSGIVTAEKPYDEINRRITGTLSLSVRPENKIGYHDRIVNLDSVISFSQILDVVNLTVPLETRYPIHQVNHIVKVVDDVLTTFSAPADFDLGTGADAGKIIWNGASSNLPAAGDRLAIHYLCHPTWLVVEHPHAVRMTPVAAKLAKRPAPAGEYIDLPLQAMIQYEFLPDFA